jgi:2,3-bisphosphoglycerate-dependent phosphoglycerate mutase
VTTQVVLVRHALPEEIDPGPGDNHPPADPGLTRRGRAQAEAVGRVLSEEGVTAVFTSPARRARETAEALCRRLGVEAVVEAAIDEWDADSTSYIPVERMRDLGDPRWERMRLGETYDASFDFAAFRTAVCSAIDDIVGRSESGTLVMFTHGGVVNAYVGSILGQNRPFWLPLPDSPFYASITRIDLGYPGDPRVISINETSHLSASMRNRAATALPRSRR